MYFSSLDIPLAILYLILLWREGLYAKNELKSRSKQIWVGFMWQLPAFILGGSVLMGLDRMTDFAYYFIFILELWHTPMLPIISLFPQEVGWSMPLYYYLLFVMAPLLFLFYSLPALIEKR